MGDRGYTEFNDIYIYIHMGDCQNDGPFLGPLN